MFFYQYHFNVAFGSGVVSCTGKKIKELGCGKALICCDEGIVKFGLLEKLTAALKTEQIPYAVYDKVVPNPLESNVVEACAMANAEQVDCYIAIGGGSSIDTAKAASILQANGKLHQENIMIPPKPGLPVIAIPTTSGTGSDMSLGAMISDNQTHAKTAVPTPPPTVSICDPELTRSLPKGATVAGAVDALMHAMEGYTSTYASKYSDLICENCFSAVRKYLPVVLENGDDMQAREELMFASSSCGSVISTAYLHIGHAVGHAIGGALDIVHGLAVAVTAPQLLYMLAQVTPKKARRIGELLGMDLSDCATDTELGVSLRRGMIELLRSWGIRNLKEMGYTLEDLCACIPTILGDTILFSSPKQVTEEDVRNILENAYSF